MVKSVRDAEKKSYLFKRSLYVTIDIVPGEIFTHENIRVIRPGYGVAPKFYEQIIGKSSSRALSAGTPLTWDFI